MENSRSVKSEPSQQLPLGDQRRDVGVEDDRPHNARLARRIARTSARNSSSSSSEWKHR